jgi:hypothetical protein
MIIGQDLTELLDAVALAPLLRELSHLDFGNIALNRLCEAGVTAISAA